MSAQTKPWATLHFTLLTLDTTNSKRGVAFRAQARHIYKMYTFKRITFLAALLTGLTAFSPQVKIYAPAKHIVINLNVEIEQEVRIKVKNDIDELFRDNKGLF
jgi:hypothetical protein